MATVGTLGQKSGKALYWGTERAKRSGIKSTGVPHRQKTCVRAKVEHIFAVVKGRFRYRKTRYRGLQKQTAKLNMVFALANLILADRPCLAAWFSLPAAPLPGGYFSISLLSGCLFHFLGELCGIAFSIYYVTVFQILTNLHFTRKLGTWQSCFLGSWSVLFFPAALPWTSHQK